MELANGAETRMLIEKKQLIDEVEQSNVRVKQMINDLTYEVNGKNLCFLSGEILKLEKGRQKS